MNTLPLDPMTPDVSVNRNIVTRVAQQPIKYGMILIGIVCGVFGIWACFAPINSAAVTQGTVVLNDYRKIIQHLEGGIIASINVKEGEFVQQGQMLLMLDKIAADAHQQLLRKQLCAYIANESRLFAEQQNKQELILYDPLLRDVHNPEIKKIIETEQHLFRSHTQTAQYHVDILNNQIEQLESQIRGLTAQKEASEQQVTLLGKEVKVVARLVEKGHETQPRLFALQRNVEELKGNIENFVSTIAKANQSINQAKLEILNFQSDRQKEIATELQETQIKINDLREQMLAANDVMNRLVVRSPYSGVVTDLKFYTKGGVIPPHSEIMTIVPQNDELIIESKLNPQDIDVVHVGLAANVRLLAYKSRYTPLLTGKVIHVSPDKLVDPVSHAPYYLVRVKVDNIKNNNVCIVKNKKFELYPGMPAEVLIITGNRTFVSYMLDPIKKTLRRSLRED